MDGSWMQRGRETEFSWSEASSLSMICTCMRRRWEYLVPSTSSTSSTLETAGRYGRRQHAHVETPTNAVRFKRRRLSLAWASESAGSSSHRLVLKAP